MNSYEKVKEYRGKHPELSIVEACGALGMTTGTYYYWGRQPSAVKKAAKKKKKSPKVTALSVTVQDEPEALAPGKVMIVITDPEGAAAFAKSFNWK